ncbi:MAG: hypothetical protein A6F71_10200 [Cycloclasticus sp. symbiont of Poecilosclerida sp. M]|nr:MAG: hypothetical protein A6F71_10200 [Cycloclasticus sp. symbiont of Poecilosclerida sp. M]
MADISTKEENEGGPDSTGKRVDTLAEYSTIASAYATSVMTEDLWTHTTFYTTTNYVLNGKLDALKDAALLDLACGSGVFCNWAVSQGASKVVGVDISEQQIAHAREIGHGNHLLQGTGCKIEYIVQDASTVDGAELGVFDVVIAVHLLCYSQNGEELRRMLKAVSSEGWPVCWRL